VAGSTLSASVLGWLLAQRLTADVYTSGHLAAASPGSVHHPYAGPAAVVATVTGAVGLVTAYLLIGRSACTPGLPKTPMRAVWSIAAGFSLLFLGVPSTESAAAARAHGGSLLAFLAVGVAVQACCAVLSFGLAVVWLRAVEWLGQRPVSQAGTPRPAPGRPGFGRVRLLRSQWSPAGGLQRAPPRAADRRPPTIAAAPCTG